MRYAPIAVEGGGVAARIDSVRRATTSTDRFARRARKVTMSHEMHHFSMGMWVFFLAYATSVVGSFVGLSCARQSLTAPTDRGHRRWMAMAALSVGGVAVWLMHFIGMMGFDIPGTAVRYALGPTVFSVALSVAATWFGLWLVSSRAAWVNRVPSFARLLVGGLGMGLAVSLMHYSGMWAIRIQGSLEHDPSFVVASVAIGVVAATVALWLAQTADRWVLRVPAALLMGCAVVALHYTGIAGVRVEVDPTVPLPSGRTVTALLFPSFVLGIAVLAVPIAALLLAPSRGDMALEEEFARWATDDDASVPGRS
ncbi:MAG: signal protein [Rhodococcus sp. (in: high G+C Gram-positive bacteria)]|nr:signal protein [Rhodococcus sp. (in: high G+C Gram-positive bacteria)]